MKHEAHEVHNARSILQSLKLPERDAYDLPTSSKRFPDGAAYRVEIPSCEGPKALRAVIEEAAARKIRVHRISQGSGIMLQTDDEIREMLALGQEHGIEICLFVGPRANWDTGSQASSSAGRVLGSSLRGADQLAYGIEDVLHGVRLGLKSILVADLGQLQILGKMKRSGDLPRPTSLAKPGCRSPPMSPAQAAIRGIRENPRPREARGCRWVPWDRPRRAKGCGWAGGSRSTRCRP